MVLEKISRLAEQFSRQEEGQVTTDGLIVKTPQHLAITMEGIAAYAQRSKGEYSSVYEKSFSFLREILGYQVKNSIPVVTILVIPESTKKDSDHYPHLLACLEQFLAAFSRDEAVHTNKVKVSVLGKWYDLPGKIIDPIKAILDETKDYDSFFFNLCINYNGQEEIVDACKLICRQAKAEKIDTESITKDTIKENCYSSYFVPPSLYIKTGITQTLPGLLLWDSLYAKIFFTGKYWPELKIADIVRAVKFYQTN